MVLSILLRSFGGASDDTARGQFSWMYWSPGDAMPASRGNGQEEFFIPSTQVCPSCTGFYSVRYQVVTEKTAQIMKSERNAAGTAIYTELLTTVLPATVTDTLPMHWRMQLSKNGEHRLTVSNGNRSDTYDVGATIDDDEFVQDTTFIDAGLDTGTKWLGYLVWTNGGANSFDFNIDTLVLSYTRDIPAAPAPLSSVPPKKSSAVGLMGTRLGLVKF